MGFTQAFGYQLFIADATSARDTHPTASTGMTELLNCSDAGLVVKSKTQQVIDYSSNAGFAKSIVTGQSYELTVAVNLDPRDDGYQLLKEASRTAVEGSYIKWYRVSPLAGGTTAEIHSGIASVQDFKEAIQAGGIAACTFVLAGYDGFTYTPAT